MLELTEKPHIELFIGANRENLEEILNAKTKDYVKLRRQEEKLDFGPTLTPKRLDELVTEVISDIHKFLDIQNAPPAKFDMFYFPKEAKIAALSAVGGMALTLAGMNYGVIGNLAAPMVMGALTGGAVMFGRYILNGGSLYEHGSHTCQIGKKTEISAIGTITHEYTHHLQSTLTLLGDLNENPIVEGHAHGVEGIIVQAFTKRYDNPAYQDWHAYLTALELKNAYELTCEKMEVSPKYSLLQLPLPKKARKHVRPEHHYNIGTAAMYIAESKHGERVYRDVLRNDFSFLRV